MSSKKRKTRRIRKAKAKASAVLSLGQKQRLFVRLKGLLIAWAYAHGYELTDGEAKRSDEQAEINAIGSSGREALCRFIEYHWPVLAAKIRNNVGSGIRNSNHEFALAQDFNLFKGGVYLSTTEAHRPLGEYWESLHPLCRWGGRFGDGNHYSIEHEGRK